MPAKMKSSTSFVPLPPTPCGCRLRGTTHQYAKHTKRFCASPISLTRTRVRTTHVTAQLGTNGFPAPGGDDTLDKSILDRPEDDDIDDTGRPGPGPEADEETIVAYNKLIFEEEPDPNECLKDTTLVTSSLPLGMVIEELPTGELFIDEIVPSGNAAKTGKFREGDIIIAVALPFGGALIPLPKEDAMEEFENHVNTQSDDTITLAVRRNDVVSLRSQIEEMGAAQYTPLEMMNMTKEVHVSWYPFVSPVDEEHEEDEEGSDKPQFNLEALQEAGLDMEGDVSYEPTDEELANAEGAEDDTEHWKELYERGQVQQEAEGNGDSERWSTDAISNGPDLWQ